MPKYEVHLPVTMDLLIVVEADDEEQAIEKAFGVPWGLQIDRHDGHEIEIMEVESHEHIVEGNCFNGCINDVHAEEIDE